MRPAAIGSLFPAALSYRGLGRLCRESWKALAVCLGIAEVTRNRMQKRLRNLWRSHSSMKDFIEGMCSAINLISVFPVLADGDAIEIDTGEDSTAARPGQ